MLHEVLRQREAVVEAVALWTRIAGPSGIVTSLHVWPLPCAPFLWRADLHHLNAGSLALLVALGTDEVGARVLATLRLHDSRDTAGQRWHAL